MFPFVNRNLRLVAEQGGYRRELLATIRDRNGRPVFEVLRFHKADGDLVSR
jgi:hypothetical protein